ncbi:helix-turn-helix domain-containing protein [Paracoccus kondratievae]|uniref:SMP-30/gluconolactonase/LRE family protein n=1 Tax=Paracoccus kondratievae TaxID=135740 RepID=UPI0012667CE7|nr:SMP-30/gluconolactonase/LRE family protein [Paracoccus kondratievae]QFQ88845.1 helix-turn-helix domain-containing protein [Paracoccus kondratievae]
MESAKSGVQGAGALLKALDIIEFISKSPNPVGVGPIAAELGMPRPTVHRIVSALEERGFLQLDSASRGFRLGFHLFELAHKAWADVDLRALARDHLDRLREISREASVLGLRSGNHFIVVDRRESLFGIRSVVPIGQMEPLFPGAFGMAILSELDPAMIAEIDPDLPRRSVGLSDGRAIPFGEAMRRAAARGYTVYTASGNDAVASVAAPILDYLGRPIAAIGVTGPASRLSPDHLHALAPDIIDSARKITSNAGNSVQSIEPRLRPKPQPSQPETRCIPATTLLGKTPRWSERDNLLYLADVMGPAVLACDMEAGNTWTVTKPDMGVLCGLKSDGGLLFADGTGLHLVSRENSQELVQILPRGLVDSRFNNCGIDPSGGYWLTSMSVRARPGEGAILRVSDAGVSVAKEGLSVPSGLAWNPDGKTIYVVESARRLILRADFDPEARRIGALEPFAEFDTSEGSPDGIVADQEGRLWVALWDGWSIARLDKAGRVERKVTLPVPRPTDLCFGGPTGQTLFITTARIRLSARILSEAPLSGSILTIDLTE